MTSLAQLFKGIHWDLSRIPVMQFDFFFGGFVLSDRGADLQGMFILGHPI